MKHPTYAADDVKAGQPVLVGDEFWSKPASGPLSGPFVADGMNESGVGCGMLRCLSHGNSFYSRPPEPKIEACVCGKPAGTIHLGPTSEQCGCMVCGRRGEIRESEHNAVNHWNADMRKMKAKGPRITQVSGNEFRIDSDESSVCISIPPAGTYTFATCPNCGGQGTIDVSGCGSPYIQMGVCSCCCGTRRIAVPAYRTPPGASETQR